MQNALRFLGTLALAALVSGAASASPEARAPGHRRIVSSAGVSSLRASHAPATAKAPQRASTARAPRTPVLVTRSAAPAQRATQSAEPRAPRSAEPRAPKSTDARSASVTTYTYGTNGSTWTTERQGERTYTRATTHVRCTTQVVGRTAYTQCF